MLNHDFDDDEITGLTILVFWLILLQPFVKHFCHANHRFVVTLNVSRA